MELQIKAPTQETPLPPVEWNYAAVKEWLMDGLSRYQGVVYDASQIGEAKKDRATLNHLTAAIDEKRKEMKKVYLAPYESFEAQAKELTAMIKEQVQAIDDQVKAFEDRRKEQKQETILQIYDSVIGDLRDLVPYERLHNPRWLNVTFSINAVSEELCKKVDDINAGLKAIENVPYDAEFMQQVKAVFFRTLDVTQALAEGERLLDEWWKMKQLQDSRKGQEGKPPQDPAPMRQKPEDSREEQHLITIDFRVFDVTGSQLRALGQYMKDHGIRYGRVPNQG